MSTFVCVGNTLQPFDRLLRGVEAIAGRLPQPVVLQHGAAEWRSEVCETIDYLEMNEFMAYVKDSELLIMHAGAGSIIHAVGAGKIPVVVPRRSSLGEHVDDHQFEFCRELEQGSRVIVCREIGDLVGCVMKAIEAQRDNSLGIRTPHIVSLVHEVIQEHVRDHGEKEVNENA